MEKHIAAPIEDEVAKSLRACLLYTSVWAVLRDFHGGINSYDETYEVLSYTSKRTRVSNQAVSYTHLDVYKRQFLMWAIMPTLEVLQTRTATGWENYTAIPQQKF